MLSPYDTDRQFVGCWDCERGYKLPRCYGFIGHNISYTALIFISPATNPDPGPWFNIKMSSYQYRKSHCGDKTILRPSYLYNGISYTGKTTSLYWIRALLTMTRPAVASWYFMWHFECDIVIVGGPEKMHSFRKDKYHIWLNNPRYTPKSTLPGIDYIS